MKAETPTQLEKHLFDEIFVFANLIQIPAVILTGAVAWLVCRPIRRWVTGVGPRRRHAEDVAQRLVEMLGRARRADIVRVQRQHITRPFSTPRPCRTFRIFLRAPAA
jgi:hypothetical protein